MDDDNSTESASNFFHAIVFGKNAVRGSEYARVDTQAHTHCPESGAHVPIFCNLITAALAAERSNRNELFYCIMRCIGVNYL